MWMLRYFIERFLYDAIFYRNRRRNRR